MNNVRPLSFIIEKSIRIGDFKLEKSKKTCILNKKKRNKTMI